jgi:molybdenum cofactor synthesis domain-containing protein
MGKVIAVCISEKRGIKKSNIQKATLVENYGIEGDAHAGGWHRQISLLSYERVQEFNARGGKAGDGDFGENILVQGIDFKALPVGTKLFCNDVILEMTQIGKECHTHCEIYQAVGDCIMPREGVFAKVLRGGVISAGDEMYVHGTKSYRAAIITASDKGFAGERKDTSGALIKRMLQSCGYEIISTVVLPDDQEKISAELLRLCDNKLCDIILTTGGTGFSVRDVTPEATLFVAQRLAPGISEAMRMHSLSITKRAMLSRGVTVIRGRTLIVNLPGSPKAVQESLDFILDTLYHGLQILCGDAGDCAR